MSLTDDEIRRLANYLHAMVLRGASPNSRRPGPGQQIDTETRQRLAEAVVRFIDGGVEEAVLFGGEDRERFAGVEEGREFADAVQTLLGELMNTKRKGRGQLAPDPTLVTEGRFRRLANL